MRVIQVKDLVKNYKVNEQSVPVLKGLNCKIEEGEFAAILGPSGCGKSTLLNILAGLTRADDGEVIAEGKSTEEYTDAEWDNWRKNEIGIIFQSFHLIPHLSALENVELAMSVAAYSRRGRRKRAKELLRRVGLEGRMKNKPGQLSGGQKQRVAIARALANNPKVLLADEPTGALDTTTSKEIMDLLHSLNKKEGVTVIMVTHDEQIASQAGRNIRMLDGEIIEDICLNENQKKQKEVSSDTYKEHIGGMKFRDSVSVAGRNICMKKKRSILTVFGIAVGIFSVVTMMGITSGISGKVSSELDSASKASVIRVITEGQSERNILTLKEKLKNAQGVTALEDVYMLNGMLAYGEEFLEEQVYSREAGGKEEDLLYGKYPGKNAEIAVTESAAEKFMGKGQAEKLLGKKITIYAAYSTENSIAYEVEKTCTVVGITSVNLFGYGNNYVTAPYAEEIAGESIGQKAEAQRTYAYLSDKMYRDNVLESIQKKGFTVASSEELIDTINGWVNMIKNFLLLITGISLAVAVVMVVIVQYMSVAERTREIGILRAIGAKKQDIRNIFLLEAGIVGTAAGILGISAAGMFGGLANDVIHELMKNGAFKLYRISNPVLAGCMLVSIVLCLLAGYMPAKQAASVDTIEVLK